MREKLDKLKPKYSRKEAPINVLYNNKLIEKSDIVSYYGEYIYNKIINETNLNTDSDVTRNLWSQGQMDKGLLYNNYYLMSQNIKLDRSIESKFSS